MLQLTDCETQERFLAFARNDKVNLCHLERSERSYSIEPLPKDHL
jgi:hypothetical protein